MATLRRIPQTATKRHKRGGLRPTKRHTPLRGGWFVANVAAVVCGWQLGGVEA